MLNINKVDGKIKISNHSEKNKVYRRDEELTADVTAGQNKSSEQRIALQVRVPTSMACGLITPVTHSMI